MPYHSLQRVIFSAGLLLIASITVKDLSAQPRASKEATVYTLTISEAQSQSRLTVKDVSHIKGDFKIPTAETPDAYDEGQLVVKVTDPSGKQVFETNCENPLDRFIESVDDKGQLLRTHVQLDTDVISLRIPFDTDGHTVSVYSVDATHRLSLLSTL